MHAFMTHGSRTGGEVWQRPAPPLITHLNPGFSTLHSPPPNTLDPCLQVARLTQLTDLDLQHSLISDAGVMQLGQLQG